MSAHPSIIVASRAQADALSSHGVFDAIIAIVGPEDRPCIGFDQAAYRLQLNFDDLVVDDANPAKSGVAVPTIEHMRKLCDFAADIRNRELRVLCHCTAGRSRSPAAALACLAVWHGIGREDESASQLFAIRPEAQPNRTLVRFAVDVLQRNGRLIAAVTKAQPLID
jgi:predicted protein tyrosine phosphatase